MSTGTRILVVEDSATQAEQLKYLLEQEGYTVSAAANGRLALEAARKRKPKLITLRLLVERTGSRKQPRAWILGPRRRSRVSSAATTSGAAAA